MPPKKAPAKPAATKKKPAAPVKAAAPAKKEGEKPLEEPAANQK